MADFQVVEIEEPSYLIIDDSTSMQLIEVEETEIVSIEDDLVTVVEIDDDVDTVVSEEEIIELLTEATQGPAGPQGPTAAEIAAAVWAYANREITSVPSTVALESSVQKAISSAAIAAALSA